MATTRSHRDLLLSQSEAWALVNPFSDFDLGLQSELAWSASMQAEGKLRRWPMFVFDRRSGTVCWANFGHGAW
jgi:hypothetical protein